ncbi:MAG TPA: hypothetical protein VFG86_20020 [Chloroflexota bacterium]|nr:hypothetical protein [Chloroflexota bacterium]
MPVTSDAESGTPEQPPTAEAGAQVQVSTVGRPRFRWRAVIRSGQKLDPARGIQPVAWHLADCDDPWRDDAHCEIGRHLIATDGNPDGHCLVGGACPRCPAAS